MLKLNIQRENRIFNVKIIFTLNVFLGCVDKIRSNSQVAQRNSNGMIDFSLWFFIVISKCEHFIHVSYSGEFSLLMISEVVVSLASVEVRVLWKGVELP